jgi:hypothetical protein
MRGLTSMERELLTETLAATRQGGGLHVSTRGDRVVMGRLERRGAVLCSPCESDWRGEDHYTATALGASILELDAKAEAPLPPGCL